MAAAGGIFSVRSIGVALGVAIPCIYVGYKVRQDAPIPPGGPAAQQQTVNEAAAPPPRPAPAGDDDRTINPIETMSKEECEELLRYSEDQLRSLRRERVELDKKIAKLQLRMEPHDGESSAVSATEGATSSNQ